MGILGSIGSAAIGAYRTGRNAVRAGTSLATRQRIISTLRLQPLLAAEKAVGGFVSDTKRPLQYEFGTKVAGVSTGTGNPTDVAGGNPADIIGQITPGQKTPTKVSGGGAGLGANAAEEARKLAEEKQYTEGLINSKYDRLTAALQKRRGQTSVQYDTAKSDVGESLTAATQQVAGKKQDISTEFDRIVEEGRVKRDKLQGSIAASFAARGLASSSGASGASATADNVFKQNVATLDEEKQTKYTNLDTALANAQKEAEKELTRLEAEKTSALEDIDSDLTLSEEERAAALHDLNANYQSSLDDLNDQVAKVQAQRVELGEAAQAEATFQRVEGINQGLASAFNRLKAAGVNPVGNAAARKYVADAYKIPEEYIDEYWGGLDTSSQGAFGPAFVQP